MDSGNFSRSHKNVFKVWVAAFIFAATLVMFPNYAFAYTVHVTGLKEWQKIPAERSLTAVVQKLGDNHESSSVSKIVSLVAEQLFSGYQVSNVSVSGRDVAVSLMSKNEPAPWRAEYEAPALRDPAAGWFAKDAFTTIDLIKEIISGVPVESLSWCDGALRNEIVSALRPVLPGWVPTFVVYSEGESRVLKVSFAPELPLLLAVNPTFSSNSLPTLLHGELKEDIMEEFSPFMGLPVLWAKKHTKDINLWTETVLGGKGIVERTASDSKVDFSAAAVSQMNVSIESSYYSLGAWAAVYGGTSEKSAEIGVHLGRRMAVLEDINLEAYGEGIIELRDWSTEGRLGLRCSPWGDVWIGGEWSSKDDMWWGRLNIDPRLHKPYAWIRVREDGEINTALGWKATQYISFELHYDSRDNDTWSLRMLGNL